MDGLYSFTGKMSTADAMDIECCGLYWHFVDIVWIIIFPVLLMEYNKLSIPNIFLMSGPLKTNAEENQRFFTWLSSMVAITVLKLLSVCYNLRWSYIIGVLFATSIIKFIGVVTWFMHLNGIKFYLFYF